MDKFEKLIKNAVEGYEAPYNPQAWENVSQGLNQTKPLKWIMGGAAAAIVAVATVVAVNYTSEETVQDQFVGTTVETVDGTVTNNGELGMNIDESNNDESTVVVASNEGNTNESNQETGTSSLDTEENSTDQNSTNNAVVGGNDQESTSNHHEGNVEANNGSAHNNDENTTENEAKTYNAEFTIVQSSVCQGQEIQCIVDQIDPEVIYVWEFGDGTVASGFEVSHKYATHGDFKVTLSLKDKHTNKTVSKNSNLVEVMAAPKVDFIWETTSKVIPTVKFINLTEEGDSFLWNIKGLEASSQNEFEYTFRNQGVYTVSMTATNSNGCESTLEKPISIEEDYNLLAPTAFTPNGDFKNDFFIPEALKIMDAEFIMTIYNEGAEMVYQTRNVNEPWDGRITKDNSAAPDGGYVWVVKVRNAQGEFDTYKGQVFITR